MEGRKGQSLSDSAKSENKVRRKRDAVERALNQVKDLAKVAGESNSGLPYGHPGWIRKQDVEKVAIPQEKIKKYSRGEGMKKKQKNTKKKLKEREIKFSIEQSARTEILLTEEPGYLENDEENTAEVTQKQIVENVDILSATKYFELFLEDFGPYRLNYTRNGRYLLLGGRRGHVAAFDWVTKKPACEINVMEETFDVQWLHNELMFAAAQKNWVYIYDNNGVELHCIKQLHNILRLDFLPYHFLLACSSSSGHLSWLDVSMGQIVSKFNVHEGRLNIMAQNPYNGVICLGHPQGTVTMWSPNSKKALAKMMCHKRPLQALAINRNGMYMATSAIDRSVQIWDLRQLNGPLQDYRMFGVTSNLAFSDRSSLAMGLGNIVEVYQNCCATAADNAYLRYKERRSISDLQFCPFEDVLGVGTGAGFTSLIVPGAGEPNFDALECNPYQTKKQRQEAEVKALLEKIQPELISLDPYSIGDINLPTMQEKWQAKKKLMLSEPPSIDFTPRRKSGKKGGSTAAFKAKNIVRERARVEHAKLMKGLSANNKKTTTTLPRENPYAVLDRLLPKTKKKRK